MDEEERNYCSLILLLTRVGLPHLRQFFIKEWNSAFTGRFVDWTDCPQNGADLLTMYNPLPHERPKVSSGNTKTWDLSMFVKALVNSTPPIVPSSKKALVDGLNSLKEARNELCHSPSGKIETPEYRDLYYSAYGALQLIGASRKEFKKVKKDVWQPWSELKLLLNKCASQDKDILKRINTINTRLDQLQQGQDDTNQSLSDIQQRQEETKQSLQQGQEETKQSLSDIQQRQEDTKQSLSDIQQRQEDTKQSLSDIQQRQEETKQSLQQGQEEIKQSLQQGQEETKQSLSDIQQRQEDTKQSLSDIQQRQEEAKQSQQKGQEEIKQSLSDIQKKLEETKQGPQQGQKATKRRLSDKQQGQQERAKRCKGCENQERPSTSSNLSSEDFELYSKKLKSSIKAQTEYQPKLMASLPQSNIRTDDIFTNLMVKHGWEPMEKKANFCRMEELSKYNKASSSMIDKCQDIFINPDLAQANPKSICVIGKPGIGKTLFCQRIARDWADDELFHCLENTSRTDTDFDFVFQITFRQLNLFGDEELSFCEVLNRCSVMDERSLISEPLFEYLIKHSEKVLFILDGYDEYVHGSNIAKSLFEQRYANNPRHPMPVAALISKVMRKKIFHNAVVMVTSRPTEAHELGDVNFDALVEITGFSVEQVEEFIIKYFKSKKKETMNAAKEHIMNNENLLSLAHIPLLCHLLCWCLEWQIENEAEKCLPATVTELYSEVMRIFEHDCQPIHRAPNDKSAVKKLSELAVSMCIQKRLMFCQQDIERFNLTCPETGSLQSFGLLTCGPPFRESPSKLARDFCFSHLTVQEYFAAVGFVESHTLPRKGEASEMVIQFCAGLLSKVEDGKRLMEEFIAPYCCCEHGLFLAKCLQEYGDKKFGIEILQKYHLQLSHSGALFDQVYLGSGVYCVALAWFLDILNAFCKDHLDLSTKSFCINKLELRFMLSKEESMSGLNRLAESIKGDSLPFSTLKVIQDGFPHSCLSTIGKVLPSPSITTLILKGALTDIKWISTLGKVLQSTSITTLKLDGDLTDEGVSTLGNALPSTAITTLKLGGDFTNEGISTLGNVLPSTAITTLKLGGDFTDEGISTLGNVLPSTSITTLKLDGDFTDEGISTLSNVLPSTSITTLKLDGDFTDEGISTLSNVLQSTSITTLKLDSDFTDEGISTLSNVLPSPSITTLSLGDPSEIYNVKYGITDEGLLTLSKVLPSTHITSLHLKSEQITEQGVSCIRNCKPGLQVHIMP